MSIWCRGKDEFLALSRGPLAEMRGLCEPGLVGRDHLDGYCRICGRPARFSLDPPPEGEWMNLREGLVCACGMNARMRMIAKVIDEMPATRLTGRNFVLERVTPLFPHLEARVPGLIGCEFLGAESAPGETTVVHGVSIRNENMMQLSFADGSVDLLMHFDVLEHVPDARAGLREAARVLADDGVMIFTCPFFHELEHDIVRARLGAGGEVEHLMEQAFHGNPMSGAGSLVYVHPSLALFAQLTEAGFDDVRAVIAYDPIEGIFSNGCPFPDGHMWPIVFVVGKHAPRSEADAAETPGPVC